MSTKKSVTKTVSSTPKQVSVRRKPSQERNTDKNNEKKEEKENKTSSRVRPKVRDEIKDEAKRKMAPAKKESLLKSTQPKPQIRRVPNGQKTTTTTATKTTKSDNPITPPSNRISKSQYFPSKNLYSNALKSEGKDVKVKTERNPSKKPHISTTVKKPPKIVKENSSVELSSDTSSMSERPRTATLRKGSIVNKNIVGPDVPKYKAQKLVDSIFKSPEPPSKPVKTETEPSEEDNYEDEEFDSYESDFDEYKSSESTTDDVNLSQLSTASSSSTESLTEPKSTQKRTNSASTDEERKLDSGNYELPENKHKQILDNIKESIERENATLNPDHNRSNLGSLSDEGFEEAKSLQFINFLGAQQKYQKRKSIEKKRKRGEELLSMIKLDTFSFTLFDLPPVPYEEFIKNFGKGNSVQTSVQTGDDDICEEIQTDNVVHVNKWTQFPPVIVKIDSDNEDFWNIYKCNYLGVGSDEIMKSTTNSEFNEISLDQFILSAGNLILNIQSEDQIVSVQESKNTCKKLPFSDSYITFNINSIDLLKERSIKNVCFCPGTTYKILSAHGPSEDDERSILCLWKIRNIDAPELFMSIFGEVTCCASGIEQPHLIFAGLTNGVISVWDISETSNFHKLVQHNDKLIRSPTYVTEIKSGHFTKVVSICSLDRVTWEETNFFKSANSGEICSLDEDGDLIIWSVITKNQLDEKQEVNEQGLAHWGSVILVANLRISLQSLHPEIFNFKCTDFIINYLDPSHIYIATNYGFIIHALSNGAKPTIKKFLPETEIQANCVEVCPFSPQFFVVGYENGDISFHSRVIEKPLISMSDKESATEKSRIRMIQWSQTRPLILYAIDVANIIHIWNLKISNMVPTESIALKENICCIKLSPVSRKVNNEDSYMMMATESGSIYLYLLNSDHGKMPLEEYLSDKKTFLNYIDRCV